MFYPYIIVKVIIQISVTVFLLAVMLFSFIGCAPGQENTAAITPKSVVHAEGIDIPVFDFDGLQPMMGRADDTVYVFNFWATWCKPCVKELPYFLAADSAALDRPVRIILVSLDFAENIEDQVIPFIIRNNVNAKVVLLDDMDANRWIPLVDPDWEGEIPATLFMHDGRRVFIAGSMSYDEIIENITNI